MTWHTSSHESLRRVFTASFSVRDIAEPLVSLDAATPAAEAHRLMQARDFDVVTVREDGLVVGYLGREDPKEGTCGEHPEALLEERRRRNQNLRLIDCLQFSDKAQIIARNEAIRRLTRFTSRRQVEEACKALESLRNNLAHSQDIITSDWEIVSLLATDVNGVIFGTENVQNAIRAD